MAVALAVVSMVAPSFPLQVSWLWTKLQGLFFVCKVPRHAVPPPPDLPLSPVLRFAPPCAGGSAWQRITVARRPDLSSKLEAVVKNLTLRVEHERVGLVMLLLLMLMGWSLTVCSFPGHSLHSLMIVCCFFQALWHVACVPTLLFFHGAKRRDT